LDAGKKGGKAVYFNNPMWPGRLPLDRLVVVAFHYLTTLRFLSLNERLLGLDAESVC